MHHFHYLAIYFNSLNLQSWYLHSIWQHNFFLPGIVTTWPPNHQSEGPHQVQGYAEPDISTCWQVWPVSFSIKGDSQLLSCHCGLLPHHLIHWEHGQHEIKSADHDKTGCRWVVSPQRIFAYLLTPRISKALILWGTRRWACLYIHRYQLLTCCPLNKYPPLLTDSGKISL